MPFTQETFFGASIRNWQSSIDWEGSPASCTVNVVVDPLNGDSFVTPIIGMPAVMQYQSWSFGGIVQSYRRTNSSNANPEYEIRLVDAREILDNAKVIVGSYTGGVLGVPNLYNVYGLYEATGYGNSGWNEAGMPWAQVRAGLLSMINGSTPLQFRGYSYQLDLSALPSMPAEYRIPGPSLSILEYISQICQDGGHDFFINLVGNIITVRTLSRLNTPASLNEINTFVNSVGGQVSSEAGRELRNETTSKMVIGGQRIDMWFQNYNGGEGTGASIWPFWGFAPSNVNGTLYYPPIVATGFNDDHNFSVDVSHLSLPGILTYNINVRELRAAAESYNDWLFYMTAWKNPILTTISGGAPTNNIGLLNTLQTGSLADVQAILPQQLLQNDFNFGPLAGANKGDAAAVTEQRIQHLYRFVASYANDYYGRQFMVALPSIGVRFNGSEYDLTRELEPAAWYDESTFGSYLSAAAAGYLPYNFNQATQGDGRFVCMVRIQNAQNYDFDDIPLDSLIFSGNDAFIKCETVGITFLDPVLLTGPRAILKLPGPIRRAADYEVNIIYLLQKLLEANGNAFSPGQIETSIGLIRGRASGLDLPISVTPASVMPDLALVPLKNKQSTYGPWVSIGTSGRVEVEINDDLVPWNYGGMTPMNSIGSALVSSAITNMQEAESGHVEFAGVPAVALGVPIVAGGPFVTGVSVNIGESGATTRYTMKTWTPKFGQVAKTQLAMIQRIAKQQLNFRNQLRNKLTDILRSPQFARPRIRIKNPALRQNSAKLWISSEAVEKTVDGVLSIENPTGLLDAAASNGQSGMGATNKGAISLDGIFRPFNNSLGTINRIPGFKDDSASADFDTVPHQSRLNPFLVPDGILGGQSDTGASYDIPGERFVGLRGPLVVAGWGYDVRGLPTPNKEIDDGVFNSEEEFSDNYKERSDKWKVGPVDLRWDDVRGVWVSDNQILEGRLNGGILANSMGLLEVYRTHATGGWMPTGKYVMVKNRSNINYSNGAFMVVTKVNYEWRPLLCCDDGSGVLPDRCYLGMGQDVEYEDFTCLNEWVEDSGVPGGRRAPTELDNPSGIYQQDFTCLDDYMNAFEFVSNVYCTDNDLIVCTRKVCLPNSWVSVEDCGTMAPPGTVPCCDSDTEDFKISNTLAGSVQHVGGYSILSDIGGGDFTWTLSRVTNRYKKTFTIPNQCDTGDILLVLNAYCDIEEDVWHLSIGTSDSDGSSCVEGNVTATASIPACATGSEVVWTNVTLPNCVINRIRDAANLKCGVEPYPDSPNDTPVGGVTIVNITLTYS